MIDWKLFKSIFSILWKSRKSATNVMKFRQNLQILTFVIFVEQIQTNIFEN